MLTAVEMAGLESVSLTIDFVASSAVAELAEFAEDLFAAAIFDLQQNAV